MLPDEIIHKTHSKNPFAMFAPNPAGVYFENQESGEKIILLLRAHIVTLLPPVLLVFFLLLLPFFAPGIFNFLQIDVGSVLSGTGTFLILLTWFLFTVGVALYRFIFWYFNVYILTNERVVDIDFRGILHKETSYAKLSQIQDVSPKIIGFFSTFFHYGNVFIQTAAERPEFEFHYVARPDKVAREILEQVRLEEAEAPGEIA